MWWGELSYELGASCLLNGASCLLDVGRVVLGGVVPNPLLQGPDSANGRASPSGAGGGFESRPRHTKGVKNGTSSYLAWRSAL